VRGDRIREALDDGRIVIVAGFQGVSADREVTTLGRGGSDLTAVALAGRFEAERCEIYSDVDGVYSANPGRVRAARRVERLDHDTMVTYARLGAGVLHDRAARRARQEHVRLRILSSFIPGPGTEVGDIDLALVPPVIGVGHIAHVVRLQISGALAELTRRLDELTVPILAVCERAAGDLELLTLERDAPELQQQLALDGHVATRGAGGSLVSVITRRDVDLEEACEEEIAAASRTHPEILAIPGATLALVDPASADDLVVRLHRAFVEEGSRALGPTPG
jgi:aspartate kinase